MSIPCIENSPYSLVFKQDAEVPLGLRTGREGPRLHYTTAARALAGMQKEALITCGPSGTAWRMFCDEGPWLNGTDLAPFPLGFFSAGLTASYLSEFMAHAKRAGVEVSELDVIVDNLYGMRGSLMRGTMTGSAFPVEVTFRANGSVDSATVIELGHMAVASSPADTLLRNPVESLFTLTRNGRQIPVTGVAASASPPHDGPATLFETARPAAVPDFEAGIIERLDDVDTLGGVKLGTERASANVGLSDNQKRRVHVRCTGALRSDGMKELLVACVRPVGSVFRLLSDDSAAVGGRERAPSGLAYLSAGIAFCFMTQLGRYAQVAGHDLHSCQVVQDTSFSPPAAINEEGTAPTNAAVITDVFIADDEGAEKARTLLRMGEQTCYLHAACRSAIKTRVRAG